MLYGKMKGLSSLKSSLVTPLGFSQVWKLAILLEEGGESPLPMSFCRREGEVHGVRVWIRVGGILGAEQLCRPSTPWEEEIRTPDVAVTGRGSIIIAGAREFPLPPLGAAGVRITVLAHMVPPSSICTSSSLPPPNKSQAPPFARPQDLTWTRHLSQLLPPQL